VVITGLGVVAPNGVGKQAFWAACRDGTSGVRPIQSFDASAYPVKVAAEVPDFDVTPFLRGDQHKSLKIMNRSTRFAVGAAGLAVRDSGLGPDWADPTRVGVCMGTGVVPIDLPEIGPALAHAFADDGQLDVDRLAEYGAGTVAP